MIRNKDLCINYKNLNHHLSGDGYHSCGILKVAAKTKFKINITKRVSNAG